MSRAVVTWSRSGRPEALRKVVRVIPSARAFMVIIWAKRSSEPPPRYSPSAAAASLADLVTRARIASSTVRVMPEVRPRRDGGMDAALPETRRTLSRRGAAVAQGLEGQVDRHHLGERGRVALLVRAGGDERIAGAGIGHDGGVTFAADLGPGAGCEPGWIVPGQGPGATMARIRKIEAPRCEACPRKLSNCLHNTGARCGLSTGMEEEHLQRKGLAG